MREEFLSSIEKMEKSDIVSILTEYASYVACGEIINDSKDIDIFVYPANLEEFYLHLYN